MGTVNIDTGVIHDDTGIAFLVPSPIPPFRKGYGEYLEEKVVGTHFTSGDDLVFKFEGSEKILSALFTTDDGTIKTFTEAAISGVSLGRQLTVANCTTNIKAAVKFSI